MADFGNTLQKIQSIAEDPTWWISLEYSSLYSSLYRSDRDWLMQHRPSKVKVTPRRIDWNARDEQISALIAQVVQKLKSGDSRVTSTSLLREVDAARWLSKLEKLPKCRALLNLSVEDQSRYACRRVKRVARVNLDAGMSLPGWALHRLAGLRPEVIKLPAVRRALSDAMAELMRAAERTRVIGETQLQTFLT
jgi:hypothetical protein